MLFENSRKPLKTTHKLSIFFREVGSRGQQLKQRSPDLPFASHLLQLIRGNNKAFPGQPIDIFTPAAPVCTPGPPPSRTCLVSTPYPVGAHLRHLVADRTQLFINIWYQFKCKAVRLNNKYIWFWLVTIATMASQLVTHIPNGDAQFTAVLRCSIGLGLCLYLYAVFCCQDQTKNFICSNFNRWIILSSANGFFSNEISLFFFFLWKIPLFLFLLLHSTSFKLIYIWC